MRHTDIRFGCLPFHEGDDRPADLPDHTKNGEWRVFENADCIDGYPWFARDLDSFAEAEKNAREEVRRQRRLMRDFDLLEGNYDTSGMTAMQFFQVKLRVNHAKIRLGTRRFAADHQTRVLVKQLRDENLHYLAAWRAARRGAL